MMKFTLRPTLVECNENSTLMIQNALFLLLNVMVFLGYLMWLITFLYVTNMYVLFFLSKNKVEY